MKINVHSREYRAINQPARLNVYQSLDNATLYALRRQAEYLRNLANYSCLTRELLRRAADPTGVI